MWILLRNTCNVLSGVT